MCLLKFHFSKKISLPVNFKFTVDEKMILLYNINEQDKIFKSS